MKSHLTFDSLSNRARWVLYPR